MKKVLLHTCCGPCACGVVPIWQHLGVEVLGFFFNPNIHPYMEFERRVEGAREMARAQNVALAVDASYDPGRWFEEVGSQAESRCHSCIAMRLERAADEAAALGCQAFSTTLSISPWQDHEAIKAAGWAAGERWGVEFAYRDLRNEYPESRRVSRQLGIYRQKYCGCLISEWERYREKQASCDTSGG